MSMKRTIPGGRVESIYTQSKNGKEVIATTMSQSSVDEDDEVIEDEIEQEEETEETEEVTEESKS